MAVKTERPAGEVFLDARGNGRAMRLTWHHEADLVVLSLWRDDVCAGTFRLSKGDVAEFVDALVDGLRDAAGVQFSGGAVIAEQRMPTTGTVQRGRHRAPEGAGVESSVDPPGLFTDWAFGDSPSSNAS
ncbi:MAG: hypothetical protein H0U61_06535 [Nocardioidaceae bacterium]|nr:hypothetical protein [Nocardioidaceae bacterium]